MRNWAIYALMLACGLPNPAHAAVEQGPLTVLVASDRFHIAPGETITLRVFVKNNLPASSPITLSAEASFIDNGGNLQLSAAAADLIVKHPVHVRQLRVSIPYPLEYVPNTAISNGRALPATAEDRSLSILLDADIAEQAAVFLTLDVISPVR